MEKENGMEVACMRMGPWPWGDSNWSFNEDGKMVIKQIVIVHGDCIDSIRFKYEHNGETGFSPKFGGDGGVRTDKFDINWPEEYLTSLTAYISPLFWPWGPGFVRSLTFYTNVTKYGPFGPQHGWCVSLPIEGGIIVGFHGRKSCYLKAIGVYVKHHNSVFSNKEPRINHDVDALSMKGVVLPREPGPWGGRGGKPWDDGVFSAIKQICIYRGQHAVQSIQIEYDAKSEQSIWTEKHGNGNAVSTITNRIKLDFPSEFFMKVTGFYGPVEGNGGLDALKSLCFYTNMGKYGPFGDETGTYFASFPGKVVGFHGRAGVYLYALGVHTEYIQS